MARPCMLTALVFGLILSVSAASAVDLDLSFNSDDAPFTPGAEPYPTFDVLLEDYEEEDYEAEFNITDPDGTNHSCSFDLEDADVDCDGYTLEVLAFEFCYGYHDRNCDLDVEITWELPECQTGGDYQTTIEVTNSRSFPPEEFEFEILDPTDPDCFPPESECDDGEDNDRDGLTDCDDPDCCPDPACTDDDDDEGANGGLCCYNDLDDDGDGDVDGEDIDCHELPGINCGDGVDNDGDGLIDCEDPDCRRDPECEETPEDEEEPGEEGGPEEEEEPGEGNGVEGPGGPGIGGPERGEPPLIEPPGEPPMDDRGFTFLVWDYYPDDVPDPREARKLAIPASGEEVEVTTPSGDKVPLPIYKVIGPDGEVVESRVDVPEDVARQGGSGIWRVFYRNPSDPDKLTDEKTIEVLAAPEPGTETGPQAGPEPLPEDEESPESSLMEHPLVWMGILLLILILAFLTGYTIGKSRTEKEVEEL